MVKCAHCEHPNTEDANFCANCGRPLQLICPNCGTANRAPANFCNNCGHALEGTAQQPAPDAKSPDRAVGGTNSERRVVTALFCDVVGSTALGGQLDPEEWTDIMNGMFDHLIAAVIRYDGTVARLMGDAILALFGAPVAHEDDPYRAVLAALDIIEDIKPYQQQIRGRLELAGVIPNEGDFEVRVGINSGLVVVGQVGTTKAGEYTAMGDAVNVASRMEQLASPGTIQIGHETYRSISALIDVESLGPVTVKGKGGAVLAYRVLGLKATRGRMRGVEGTTAPMAGRQRELELMSAARDELLEGKGKIVCIIGEAGLGKSRLIEEFKSLAGGHAGGTAFDADYVRQPTMYEAESLSFEVNKPYGLMQRLLRRLGGISRSDSTTAITGKIAALTQSVPHGSRAQVTRALEALFHFDPETKASPLRGEALRTELIEAQRALTRAHASTNPTAMILEDLHWADQASTEMVRELLSLVHEVALLLICVFRPERRSPAWKVKQTAETECADRYLEITLKPLQADESDLLVGGLLQMAELPERLGRYIKEKADGVPFFVEEIVRELKERDALLPTDNGGWRLAADIDEVQIPESLEAVLLARIDRLESSPRRTLQLAAVVGRSFHLRVLNMIAENTEQLDRDLIALQQSAMIEEISRYPEVEYRFHHGLMQEAAYNTILRRQRFSYHKRIGEAVEQLFAESLEEHAPLLAHHFREAHEPARSFPYSLMAADEAARLFANDEAIAHYDEAIKAAGAVPAGAVDLASLYMARGAVHEVLGAFEQASSDHNAALQVARDELDRKSEWRALLELGKLWASRDYRQTGDFFRQALELARLEEEPLMLAQSLNRLGNWRANTQTPLMSLPLHQEALGIFEKLEDQRGLADTLDFLGMSNALIGRISDSHTAWDRAIAIYRELNDDYSLASTLAVRSSAMGNEFLGTRQVELADSKKYAREALAISRRIGWPAGESIALISSGSRQIAVGDYGAALESLESGLRGANAIGHRQWITGLEYNLGLLHCHLLAGGVAVQHSEKALALSLEIDSTYWKYLSAGALAHGHIILTDYEGGLAVLEKVAIHDTPMDSYGMRYCWGMLAELKLRQGYPTEAIEITGPIIAATESITPGFIPMPVRRVRAEAFAELGRLDEAESLLLPGISDQSTGPTRPLQWRLHASLGRLYVSMGKTAEAEAQFDAGRKLVKRLAESLPDGGLKNRYLHSAGLLLSAPV